MRKRSHPSLLPVAFRTSFGIFAYGALLAGFGSGIDRGGLMELALLISGLFTLPFTVIAGVMAWEAWPQYSARQRFIASVLLALAAVGTWLYWKPIYDFLFGSWA